MSDDATISRSAAVCSLVGLVLSSPTRGATNLVIVAAYGMIRWKQQDMKLPDFGLEFGNPDFVRYAESYGAKGHRVKRTADLAPLLSDCLNRPGVHLIDCPIDYSDSQHQLMEAIPARSKALSL